MYITLQNILILFSGPKLNHFNRTLNCTFYCLLTVVSFIGPITAGNDTCCINVYMDPLNKFVYLIHLVAAE